MKISLFVFLISMALLTGGCATNKSNQPDWISGYGVKYTKSEYLLGRGLAKSVEDAKKRALADLAETFQVSIKSSSEDVQNLKSNSKTPDSNQFTQESTRRINTTSEQIVRGIQVAEIWQDPASKDYYVLAALQRQPAVAGLRQQIEKLDDAVHANIEQSTNNMDLFVKLASLSKAITTQHELDGLQNMLQVLSPSGRGLDTRYNSGRLKSDLEAQLKRVRVVPKVLEGSVKGLDEVVAGALAKAGFMIDVGEKPVFLLKASLVLSDLGIIDGWYWQRGNLEISVSESVTGRVRGVQRWPIKSNGRDKASAVRHALDEAETVLRSELGAAIISMATTTK